MMDSYGAQVSSSYCKGRTMVFKFLLIKLASHGQLEFSH